MVWTRKYLKIYANSVENVICNVFGGLSYPEWQAEGKFLIA
jgi:hypothetical protein